MHPLKCTKRMHPLHRKQYVCRVKAWLQQMLLEL